MTKLTVPSVDVVIPVYNAPELTKRCVESVVTYLGQSVRYIYLQDDASDAATFEMLEHLPHEQLHVYHVSKNQGFGRSVNEAIERSDADFILVLNSDTEVCDNFIPLLCAAFIADPKLAVISPAHQYFAKYDVSRYLRRPGGYIPTYRFQGYAFLIRRHIFLQIGGFDTKFGRGYFEDRDLGRRLDLSGWHIGIHPDTYIHHKGGGSFGRGQAYRLLMQHNRAFYLTRYPDARRNVLLVSSCSTLADLPIELLSDITQVFRRGGTVHWLTPVPAPKLLCLHMRNSSTSLVMVFRLMLRGYFRVDKRISSVYVLPDVPRLLRGLLVNFARLRKLDIRFWVTQQCQSVHPDALLVKAEDPSSDTSLRTETSQRNIK